MKKTGYSYIGISFVILLFGIWAVPKIVDSLSPRELAVIGTVPDFEFTDQNGKTITNKEYAGKVYVAEFFFTSCPTICPVMNQNMVKVQNEFYGNPNLGIASFSINPEYDSPTVLKEYADRYGVTNPNWHFLTGKREQIHQLANAGFNLYVGEAAQDVGGFEHSGMFALIDREDKIRSRYDDNGNPIIYYDGLEAEGIQMLIEDIELLLK
jgi:protein SCO1/2